MRVVAFAPALSASAQVAGGVIAEGFPMTSFSVATFPAQITIPLVVAVFTSGGTDYDVRRYIAAVSPDGERVGGGEFSWHWDDNPPSPFKFRVFTPHLPIRVQSAGVYMLGLYDSPEATDTEHVFPLPILKQNVLTRRTE